LALHKNLKAKKQKLTADERGSEKAKSLTTYVTGYPPA
jgi:hypothetical protein